METKHSSKIPVQHIIGFILSLTLTLIAAWAAIKSELPVTWIVIGIMVLAVIQAGIQLFMFMHMTESASGGGHAPWNMMFHGFVIAAIVVAGSLFTMSFGHDHGGDPNQHDQQNEQHQEHMNHE
ncbi:cytochrome aa3 quinol oxidase subunit IV [Virgibacillus necropolis]|uniref:Quinol oxidase subunit 4 n=1 Tax=Virgibacillus necropolis TaxID=163877 RepID=A0A221MEM4_9BACI|nr:cytochrome aa3 quinol oxidase subunit IV [Virgibacillus necropolis]ASN06123.1 cytochrome aa3 quinol oxidase subunit IV [Virgibacillus necropolis]